MIPIKPTQFGLAHHKFQQFHAVVPGNTTDEDLVNPDFWPNVASMARPGDIIWVRADDDSWVGQLYVKFQQGQRLLVSIVYRAQFEEVDYDTESDMSQTHILRLCGVKKYCIIERETGDPIMENIPTKAEGEKELAQYLKALAA